MTDFKAQSHGSMLRVADVLEQSERRNRLTQLASRPVSGRDRRELVAIFAGGVVGALLRVALLQAHAGAAHGWPWVTFACQHPRLVPARLFRHTPAGAPAPVGLSPAAARNRVLWRLHHVLDDAGRAADDARRPSLRACGRVRRIERDPGVWQRSSRNAVRPPGEDDRVSLLVWIAVGVLGGIGALGRFVVDGVVVAAYRTGLPAGHAGGQSDGRDAARVSRRSGASPATAFCLPGPRCSVPTRRSRPGCSRPSGLSRMAKRSLAGANVLISLVAGVGAAALGRFVGAHV